MTRPRRVEVPSGRCQSGSSIWIVLIGASGDDLDLRSVKYNISGSGTAKKYERKKRCRKNFREPHSLNNFREPNKPQNFREPHSLNNFREPNRLQNFRKPNGCQFFGNQIVLIIFETYSEFQL